MSLKNAVKTKIFAVGLIVILLMSGMVGIASAEDSVKLFGHVTDEEGIPLNNCYVTVHDEKDAFLTNVKTDANGYYVLVVPPHPSYRLFVEGREDGDPYLFDYIPVQKDVFIEGPGDVQVNISLKPGANIIIHAYDSSGNLLRNKDFRELTNSSVFATDLDNLPCYADFNVVHDSYSDWNWDLATPAFIVLPQTLYKIFILWEVDGFGKVILSADNEGKGYSVAEQEGKIILNFNYEVAKSKIAALQGDYDLFKSQGYKISDSIKRDLDLSREHLAVAEEYLYQVPTPDIEKAIGELNASLKLALWAHERLYLERAEADIEKYRKGDARIKAVDEVGEPISGCNITFKQTSHDFLFGAVPIVGQGHLYKEGQEDIIQDILKEAGINYSQIKCYWEKLEPSPGEFKWDAIDRDQDINGILNKGYALEGGLAIWFIRFDSPAGFEYCPKYQDNMTFEELKENIYGHTYALASRYEGRIDTWQINEPNLPWTNVLDLTWEQKLEAYAVFIDAVKDTNPEAKIIINSFALPFENFISKLDYNNLDERASGISFIEFLNLMIKEQIPFNSIELECYYGGVTIDGSEFPGLDLTSTSSILDQYSKYDKPILVSELSAPSIYTPNSSWWHKPWDEETQAEYLATFYTIVFGKPFVQGISWSFGVTDVETFIKNGGLLDSNLNPKPSYYTLKNLINSWTTGGNGITSENGEFKFRGFAGDYGITLESATGRTFETPIHIYEQHTNEITIKFPPVVSEVPKPSQPSGQELKPLPTAPLPEEPQSAVTPVVEEEPSPERNSVPLIAGIIGGIVVIGLVTLFLIRKR